MVSATNTTVKLAQLEIGTPGQLCQMRVQNNIRPKKPEFTARHRVLSLVTLTKVDNHLSVVVCFQDLLDLGAGLMHGQLGLLALCEE